MMVVATLQCITVVKSDGAGWLSAGVVCRRSSSDDNCVRHCSSTSPTALHSVSSYMYMYIVSLVASPALSSDNHYCQSTCRNVILSTSLSALLRQFLSELAELLTQCSSVWYVYMVLTDSWSGSSMTSFRVNPPPPAERSQTYSPAGLSYLYLVSL